MQKINILVELSYYNMGRGISTYQENLMHGLAGRYSAFGRFNLIFLIPFPGLQVNYRSGLNCKVIWYFPRMPQPIWDNFIVPLAAYIYRCKIVHYTAGFCGIFGRRFFQKQIVTIHDVSYLERNSEVSNVESVRQYFGRLYRRLAIVYTVADADHLLPVSDYTARELVERFKIPTERIHIIKNSTHIPDQSTLSRLIEKRRSVLIVGGDSCQKNLERTLNVATAVLSSVPNWIFEVVGVSEPRRDTIKNLHFLGKMSREKLTDHYRNARILLMPSLCESFSLPLVEAAAYFNYVVMSNTCAPPTVLPDNLFTFNPYDENAMFLQVTSAIQRAEANPCFLQDDYLVGQFNYVANNYSLETMADSAYSLYELSCVE